MFVQSRTDQRLAWGLVKSQQAFPFLATTRLAVSVSIYSIGLFRTILDPKGTGVRPFWALTRLTRWWLVHVWRGDVIGTILRVETRSSQIWDKVLRTYGLKLSNLPVEGASDPPYIPRGSGEGLSMRRPVRVGRRRRGRPNMGVVPACGGQAFSPTRPGMYMENQGDTPRLRRAGLQNPRQRGQAPSGLPQSCVKSCCC